MSGARRSRHRGYGRIGAVLALALLVGTPLLPLVQADVAGWRADHGHISLSGVVPDHTHPWDDPAESSGADGAEADVVFTMGDDGAEVVPAQGVPELMAVLTPPAPAAIGAYRLVRSAVVAVEAPPPKA